MLVNGKSVSRETQEKLEHFANLFQKWSAKINLVAPSTVAEMWTRHIADSAQIFHLSPTPLRWLDMGSGGGFPGIVTAIFLSELEDGWVHLVESSQKKAAFLRVALSETDARGSVHPVRVEASLKDVPTCERISSRALADLDQLLSLSGPWMLGSETRAFFHKGREYAAEVEKARGRWDFDLLEHRSVVEKDSVVLEISGLRHKEP
jgi:16S rRNA (guanine527-N7)-methyltransferase